MECAQIRLFHQLRQRLKSRDSVSGVRTSSPELELFFISCCVTAFFCVCSWVLIGWRIILNDIKPEFNTSEIKV